MINTQTTTNELEIISEKRDLKKDFNPNFLFDLDVLLEKCFLMPKKKKEHFITKEKLEIEFIKLLLSLKRFSTLKEYAEDISALAIFDVKTKMIGKIICINNYNKTVEYQDCSKKTYIKPFEDVSFFDMNTVALQSYADMQLKFNDITFKETYRFLYNNSDAPAPSPRVEMTESPYKKYSDSKRSLLSKNLFQYEQTISHGF